METRTYTVSEARSNLAEVINRVTYTEQPAVITKSGKEKVAVVPYRLLELLTRFEALFDLEEAQKALDDYTANGGVSLDDIKRELGLTGRSVGDQVGNRAPDQRRKSRAKKAR